MSEIRITSINEYPDIEWSKPIVDEHGDPDSTFGIMDIVTADEHVWLDYDHNLIIIPREDRRPNRLSVGIPRSKRAGIIAEKGFPFSLEDSSRMNEAVVHTFTLLKEFHRSVTARRVKSLAEQLLITLRGNIGVGNESDVEEIGILEKLMEKYREETSKTSILEAANRLKDLRISAVFEGISASGSTYLTTPDSEIEYYTQGKLSPLNVDDLLTA